MNIIIGGERPKLPARLERLFASASIPVPAHGKIPIHDVDRALKGLDIEERLYLKARLRELGRLA